MRSSVPFKTLCHDGYYIALRMFFLGRELRHSGASFYKLSLFRRGKGRFECRLKDQDQSMADMEVHEHIVMDEASKGKAARLKHPLLHHNVESLSHYIRKHDEYSNWEARVWLAGDSNSERSRPRVVWIAGPTPSLAAEDVLRDAGLADFVFLLQVHFLDGISRWRSRPDLLRPAGCTVFSHQSEDL